MIMGFSGMLGRDPVRDLCMFQTGLVCATQRGAHPPLPLVPHHSSCAS